MRRARDAARWMGAVVEIAGVATLATAVLPDLRSRTGLFNDVVMPGLARAASGVVVLAGVTLVLVAGGWPADAEWRGWWRWWR